MLYRRLYHVERWGTCATPDNGLINRLTLKIGRDTPMFQGLLATIVSNNNSKCSPQSAVFEKKFSCQFRFYPSGMQGYAMPPSTSIPSMPELQSPYPQPSRTSPNWVLPTPAQQGHLFMPSRAPVQQEFYPVKSEDIAEWEQAVFQHQHVDPLQPYVSFCRTSAKWRYV